MNFNRPIHIWCPGIFHFKGGIQVYSAFLLKALSSLSLDIPYQVFLKNDTAAIADLLDADNIQFHCSGKYLKQLQTLHFSLKTAAYGLWQRPQLIITTHLHFAPIADFLKHLTGQPYWLVAHGLEAWNIQRPLLKTALQHADLILAVSHYTRDRLLQEQSLDPAKVVVLPNTFDTDRFRVAPKPTYLLDRYGFQPDQPIILTVARLAGAERYKGYDQIINALPQVQRIIPKIQYLLVGQGDDYHRIQQLVNHLNLNACVKLAGFVPEAELVDHYNLCDVFAMPGKGEGFGIVYLEALACGKPVIGGNQDGSIDALGGGTLGALVNPDNLEEITTTLIQILQRTYLNPILYQPNRLRQEVIQMYGFASFKQRLGIYINQTLGS